MIGIIDYGMGNLGSVGNACRFIGAPAKIVTTPGDLSGCGAMILPGVGAFGDCVSHMTRHGFIDPVRDWIAAKKPFLGICLGLQMLFEGSEESPGVPGLGVFRGQAKKFRLGSDFKVPQIGWNQVQQRQPACPLFAGVPDNSFFYFVHSFYVEPEDAAITAGTTDYGMTYTSAVWKDNVMAVQFHPEKSHDTGLRMLKNFAELGTGS
ncbi:MAG TPA: imidazole glycerol phosphate synthase subunit HisH [Kiritimatiellia bacterium]|nr:imidazole glycerol phosphate synthase subunit HisH [Kiritimatiellia bacterium]